MKFPPVVALVRQSAREAMHARAAWIPLMGALALIAGGSVLRALNFAGDDGRFLHDTTEAMVLVLGLLEGTTLAVALVHGPWERGGAAVLFSHGVRRTEWMMACFAVVGGGLLVLAGAMHLALAIALRRAGLAVDPVALAQGMGVAAVRMVLLAAFAVMSAAIFRGAPMVAAAVTGLTIGSGLAPIAASMAVRASPLEWTGWMLVRSVVPEFPAGESVRLGTALVALAYAGVCVAAGGIALRWREI